ncbi:MAG: serine hydrolase, partial [Saprospiraceae bacterium]
MEVIKGKNGRGTLLSAESYAQIFRGRLDDSHFEERNTKYSFNDEYDYGIFMGLTPKDFIGHSGGDPGITSFMFFDPKTNMGRTLVINSDLHDDDGIKEYFEIWQALGKYIEGM